MRRQHLLVTFSALVVITGLLFTIPACASSHARAYVRVGPPPPVVERILVAPGPSYVWLPGFYRWDGRAYIWMPGRYVMRPRARAVWVPGRWMHNRRGWFWVDGRWR